MSAKIKSELEKQPESTDVKENNLRLLNSDKEEAVEEFTFDFNEVQTKFFAITDESWEPFTWLIKRYVYSENTYEHDVLRTIDFLIDDTRLQKVSKSLTQGERFNWDKLIAKKVSKQIDIQMMVENLAFLVKKLSLFSCGDKELDELLLSLDYTRAIRFINDNIDLSSHLLGLLPTDVAAQVMNGLNGSSVNHIIDNASNNTDVNKGDLKVRLKTFMGTTDSSFYASIGEIANNLDESRKTVIIKNVIAFGDVGLAKKIAYDSFPSDSFQYLEPDMLKSIMREMDMNIKVNFLVVLNEDDRTYWQNLMASPGSKAMEVIEIELTQILNNEPLFDKYIQSKDLYKENFYKQIRSEAAKEEFLSQKKAAINAWFDNFS